MKVKIAEGVFTPGPPHTLRGGFEIFRTNALRSVVTSDDFFFDGSPAPGFALTKGAAFNDATARRTEIGRLRGSASLDGKSIEVSGSQTMFIPPSLNLDTFDTLILWCFKVPFLLCSGAIRRI